MLDLKKADKNGKIKNVKSVGWYTAMYYYAEHIRELSSGSINYKILYSLVGTNGHYVNHENAAMRVHAAPGLSRLIHSWKYSDDLKLRYYDDPNVFETAAKTLFAMLINTIDMSEEDLLSYLISVVWPEVRQGLKNESESGRVGLKMDRVNKEMAILFEWSKTHSSENYAESLIQIISSYFHLMAFGYLDSSFSSLLLAETPLDIVRNKVKPAVDSSDNACFLKIKDESSICGSYFFGPDKVITIGRYTDCDIIEEYPYVSRLHCRSYFEDGRWVLEDVNSKHGTVIIRDGKTVFDSGKSDSRAMLEYGDQIILAKHSQFWFASVHPSIEL